jgi:ubiquinone/menaquinone biosynthesis C-methylase UbiE
MEWLARHVPPPLRLVVDLGCGTGRFTLALQKTFCAAVLGVEPAANMRAAAESKPHPPAVRFVDGSAKQIPLENGAADLVFMSQVFHHLVERAQAFREIHRVLAPAGRLCLRQTTRENLDSYFYQRFFPEARALDEQRLPSREELTNFVSSCGYRLLAFETMRHEIAATGADYVAKISTRTYSDLECISEGSFRSGLNALRGYCCRHPVFPTFAENDVYVVGA